MITARRNNQGPTIPENRPRNSCIRRSSIRVRGVLRCRGNLFRDCRESGAGHSTVRWGRDSQAGNRMGKCSAYIHLLSIKSTPPRGCAAKVAFPGRCHTNHSKQRYRETLFAKSISLSGSSIRMAYSFYHKTLQMSRRKKGIDELIFSCYNRFAVLLRKTQKHSLYLCFWQPCRLRSLLTASQKHPCKQMFLLVV